MPRLFFLLLLLALPTLAGAQEPARPAPLKAERRSALVIGNAAYEHMPALGNPGRDTALITQALETVGFNVRHVEDLDRKGMLDAVLRFTRNIGEQDQVALIYFAGHGVQVGGRNYLMPTDANPKREEEVEIFGIDIEALIKALATGGPGKRPSIIVIDACRDNPFAKDYRGAVSKGLAPVTAPPGTLIAYSTSPGSVAYDGADGNSPYARALAQAILEDELTIEQAFKMTRILLQHRTGRLGRPQTSWETTSLVTEFGFRAREKSASPPDLTIAASSALKSDASLQLLGRKLSCPLESGPLRGRTLTLEFDFGKVTAEMNHAVETLAATGLGDLVRLRNAELVPLPSQTFLYGDPALAPYKLRQAVLDAASGRLEITLERRLSVPEIKDKSCKPENGCHGDVLVTSAIELSSGTCVETAK